MRLNGSGTDRPQGPRWFMATSESEHSSVPPSRDARTPQPSRAARNLPRVVGSSEPFVPSIFPILTSSSSPSSVAAASVQMEKKISHPEPRRIVISTDVVFAGI